MNILDLRGREPVRATRTGRVEIAGGVVAIAGGVVAIAAAVWFLFYLLPAIIG